ncbi:MAG: recombination mediator RecR [Candidatus Izemoplasmatales bacterium]|jgi:recombination protein RecR|nr:recombination mediator RecR [Candidatus Izemoplasmatales bacterium]
MQYPKSLEDLIVEWMKYPGIGRKTAERYAMFTVNQLSKETVELFAQTLLDAKSKINPCKVCGHFTDLEICEICADHQRDGSKVMIVESSKDVFTIEKSGTFKGLYHVLNGALSPINGIGPNELNLFTLWTRLENQEIKEIIIATSATQEGEATALYIKRVLQNTDILVTRIGYGVPVGSNLEYADDLTLVKAIENRRVF